MGKQRRSSDEVKKAKTLNSGMNETVTKRLRFKALNPKQKEFNNLILENQITFALGSPGTGKSYISLFKALELVQMKTTPYNKILIYTPIVAAGEDLGFLPGNKREKIEEYLASSLGLIDKIIGKSKRIQLEEAGVIELDALAFIRGNNIDNSILVMEEAQNMSTHQMKTLLTRLGDNSKFIISGDLEQSDRYNNPKQSGLYDAKLRFNNDDEIGMVEFNDSEIVRNPIIKKILNRYKEIRSDIKKAEAENQIIIEELSEKKPFWKFF